MEPSFASNVHDMHNMLSSIKSRLMSGTGNAQVSAIEQILRVLKETDISERDAIVEQIVKFDIIPCICNAMQISNESYMKFVLEFFEFISVYKKFYENRAAVVATELMLRLCYCMSKSLKDLTLFEELVQSVCNILVRSFKLTSNLNTACVPQQVIYFIKNLDIQNSQNKLRFMTVTMLSVVLRQETFDENFDEEMIIDVCRGTLKSMIEIVKCGNDDNTTLSAATLLCNICAGSCRFCVESEVEEEKRSEAALKICQKRIDLLIYIYNTTIDVIIPFVKDADLSRVDSIELHGNLISCLNNLYRLRNCNCDNLSNHLAANGYLKYFLRLTVQLPDNLRRDVCTLLSRVLSILGKATLSKNTVKLENNLHQGFLDLPKDSTERWSDILTHPGKDGTALTILLYYHFLGTREIDIVALQSLVARIMMLPKSAPVSVPILKPLWFLFAVTSVSQPHSNFVPHYESAVNLLMYTLQCSDISKFYTHHIDLLRYCLKCQYVAQSIINQVLNLWLIESDGDIKPLLSFNCEKVVRHLLIVIQTGYPKNMISLAVKGFRHLIEISKKNKDTADRIGDIVWHILPNVLSSYQTDAAHIEAVLELSNITQPPIVLIEVIIRSADSITDIMLKKDQDPKLISLVVEQANILLMSSLSRKSFEVLEMYIQKSMILKKLYIYGFSEDRSQLATSSIKLLAFIIYSQKRSSLKCQQPLVVHIKSLLDLLTYTLKSLSCAMYEIQFVCELLTQNVDGLAITLQEIAVDSDDMYTLLNLYEILHTIHAQKDPIQKDAVHQGLVAVLRFCNAKLIKPLPYLCTTMSNYDLVFNIVNMRYVSSYFVEFVTTWLYYRKANCKNVLWNSRSLYKTPFDEVLDHLRKYSVIIKNNGLEDAYLSLTDALSQFK